MNALLRRLRAELGWAGTAGLALLGAALAFLLAVLQPLEERSAQLERRLEERAPAAAPGVVRTAAAPAGQLAAFYAFLERGREPPQWLERLHALAADAGLALPSADYRLHDTGTPLQRYEIVLPVSGSYAELRAFLEAALAEIPVLSLDAVSFSRQHAGEARLRAELRLTLHLVAP